MHNPQDQQRLLSLEGAIEILSNEVNNLNDRLNLVCGDVALLGKLGPRKAALLQLLATGRLPHQAHARLGITKDSARTLKLRAGKYLKVPGDIVAAYHQELARQTTDQTYLALTGVPKTWAETYSDVSPDKDPWTAAIRATDKPK
ncbi:hypothetical protein [Ferrimonas marina]|uniref:Uncharacterized protein n=1 Tax=Ferrimonas marina TaxID=299255 RepID=A0A1M5UBZ1_9GAMM|nr:hypothetical protein [Ferrimonas marina]SHH60431.1 hypothetical protein SAMN02745129_2492 [Ferrimonas marina]